jgi:hypothetical protein
MAITINNAATPMAAINSIKVNPDWLWSAFISNPISCGSLAPRPPKKRMNPFGVCTS